MSAVVACPVCFGEGQHDHTDSDAWFGEHFSDHALQLMREEDGFIHPVGVVECDECEGTRVVTVERALDLRAAARAYVDQIIALHDEREARA